VKTFVLMTKFAAQDAKLVEVGAKLQDWSRNGESWLKEIRQQCPEIQFKAHYALLGYWDFMTIYAAPDEETAAKVSILSRAHGAYRVESWPAIPYERILKLTEDMIHTREAE
jgi:uncharacterized protein with GYD domain